MSPRNRDMVTSTLRRTKLIAALIAAMCLGTFVDAQASDPRVPPLQVTGSDLGSRFVQLGVGKSLVIDLSRDVKDVLVSDPTIANAVVRSTRRAYLIGVKSGRPTSTSSTPTGIRSPASTSPSRAISTASAR
jgi:pilus assembly protein CpaC